MQASDLQYLPHEITEKERRVRWVTFVDAAWCWTAGFVTWIYGAERFCKLKHFGPYVHTPHLKAAGVATSLWAINLFYWAELRSDDGSKLGPLWRERNQFLSCVNNGAATALWIAALYRKVTPVGRLSLIATSLQIYGIAALQMDAGSMSEERHVHH